MMTGEIFILLVVLLVLYCLYGSNPYNFPPGPIPLPLIGNLLSIGVDPHIAFTKFSKKYGSIVGVKFGNYRVICVHGAKLIRETFSHSAFTGREIHKSLGFIFGDNKGITMSSGGIWNEQRRFAIRHLRDFGFGKNSMEDMITVEVKDVCDWLKRQHGESVMLHDRFALAVVNGLWKILTGERFDHDDKKLHQIIEDLERSAKIIFGFNSLKTLLIFFSPKLAKMFPNWSGWNRLKDAKRTKDALLNRIIDEHAASLPENNPRDFLDVYLQEVKSTVDPNSSFHPTIGKMSLKSVMADFFVASTDTTAVTLCWLYLYLLHNPSVQRKLHEELDQVVGGNRTARLMDRKSLPYTEAVILETLRLSSIVPYAAPHTANADTKFQGYDIPKGTMIFANLHAHHHDPNVWGDDVEEFRPERFLSSDGRSIQNNDAVLSFSVGRRACLGETLARDTLFLFVANLSLEFEVSIQDGEDKPPLDFKPGQLTLSPKCSTVVMKERRQ